jgi:hypothetical protein
LVHYTGIEVCATKGYVCLALLKQVWVIHDSSAVCPHPGHVWPAGRAANLHAKRCNHDET